MQELPDRQFDAEITRALKFRAVVTPLQKQNARERLLLRAAENQCLCSDSVISAHYRADGGRGLRQFEDQRRCHMRLFDRVLADVELPGLAVVIGEQFGAPA